MGSKYLLQLSSCTKRVVSTNYPPFHALVLVSGKAAILYECRLGCLEKQIPQETQDYISALNLMFSSFKTTMYAGAIPKWLRPVIPKPWEEFCKSWDGLFRFSMWFLLFLSTGADFWYIFMFQYAFIWKGYSSSLELDSKETDYFKERDIIVSRDHAPKTQNPVCFSIWNVKARVRMTLTPSSGIIVR